MRRYLWARVGLVAVVAAASLWYLYPPGKTINLGLDLRGGVHLVLGVEVEKAIESQLDRAAADLKGTVEQKGIAVTRVARDDHQIIVQLASPQAWGEATTAARDFRGYDFRALDQAAGRFALALPDREVRRIADLAVLHGPRRQRDLRRVHDRWTVTAGELHGPHGGGAHVQADPGARHYRSSTRTDRSLRYRTTSASRMR